MANEMRDRLVELLEQKMHPYLADDIADYLIENGVTFKQVIYFPFPRVECDNCPKSKGKDMACEELELLYDGKHPKYTPQQDFDLMCEICPWEVTSREYREDVDKENIGKTKFFTKAEAEQKLKEMRGSNG